MRSLRVLKKTGSELLNFTDDIKERIG